MKNHASNKGLNLRIVITSFNIIVIVIAAYEHKCTFAKIPNMNGLFYFIVELQQDHLGIENVKDS